VRAWDDRVHRLAVGLTIAAYDHDTVATRALLRGTSDADLFSVIVALADLAAAGAEALSGRHPGAGREGLASFALSLAAE
jgi:hypothetical protein